MTTSPPSNSVETTNHPDERPDPGNELGSISATTTNGARQDTPDADAPPVIESTESGDNLTGDQASRGSPSEVNSDRHLNQSSASDKTKVNFQLLAAAVQGDLEGLEKAIDAQADPSTTGTFSETAFHKACRHGHESIVEELLKHESFMPCLRKRDDDGWTPLISACYRDDASAKRIVELLLKHHTRLDIDAKSFRRERTALHVACWESTEDVIQLLLHKNAAVNLRDHRKCTPLTLACERQTARIVELLLEAGASCDAIDEDGDTPLILASRFGDSNMVAKVLEYNPEDMSSKNKAGKDALSSAILNVNGRDRIIPLLLNKGLKLDRKDASKIFPRGATDKTSRSRRKQSAWQKLVQDMIDSNNPKIDKPLTEAIKPILEFASKEEKVFAILNAQTKKHFDVLQSLTADLGLSQDICTLIWVSGHEDRQKILDELHLEDLAKKMLNVIEVWGKSKQELIPETRLQWSAYYGEHDIVWCLLKESQSMDKDIQKSLAIAKAKKPTSWAKSKKGTVANQSDKEDDIESKEPLNVKDKEKQDVEKDSRRYEFTIDILSNATNLVSIPKKQLIRPGPSDIEGKESLLQKSTATIVSLYEREGQVDLLRSSPSVFDLVYENGGEGVNAVMEMARSTFDGMTNTTLDERVPTKNLKLRWIHLPANNMDWMEHLTLRIFDARHTDDKKTEDDKPENDEKPEDDEYLTSFMDLAQRSQNELPTDKSDVKFMKPICLRERDGADTKLKTLVSRNLSKQNEPVETRRLALYTPYVTFGHCYPRNKNPSDAKHADLLKHYEGRILHGPRSLDRFYYNALPIDEMDERDMSQVVTRGLLKQSMGESLPMVYQKWPFLTIDQLWVWVIDNETVITSSTHREDEFENLLVDKVWENLLQASQKGLGENLPSTVTEMSQFLVSTCVGFINNLTWDGVYQEDEDQTKTNKEKVEEDRSKRDAKSKSILLLYTDSINAAAAEEKKLFKFFTERTTQAENRSKEALEAAKRRNSTQQLAGDNNANDDNSKSMANLNKDIADWEAINKAAMLLDDVKDIRDELVILQSLVTQQGRVWAGLMGPHPDSHDARSPSFITHELDAMIQMTEAIQKAISDLLTLEENSINIKESMMSRDLVDESANHGKILVQLGKAAEKQNAESAKHERILFTFTVMTVLFTPLSFIASLLGLNTTASRHNDDGELEWEPALMYGIIFGVSAIVVTPFMFYASLDKIKKVMDWLFPSLLPWLSRILRQIKPTDARSPNSAEEDGKPSVRRSRDIEEGISAGNSTPKPLSPQSESLLPQ